MAGILDGKVALITGAGSGIGRATSKIFAREGAKLVLADVVEAGGNETLKMLKDAGANAVFIKCDACGDRPAIEDKKADRQARRLWGVRRRRRGQRSKVLVG